MLTSFWNFHSRPSLSQAEKVQYPLRPAVFSWRCVPKNSAAICAAFALVMLFISTSTPMVWFLMPSICTCVFFIVVSSGWLCFPFVVYILTLKRDNSKPFRNNILHEMYSGIMCILCRSVLPADQLYINSERDTYQENKLTNFQHSTVNNEQFPKGQRKRRAKQRRSPTACIPLNRCEDF